MFENYDKLELSDAFVFTFMKFFSLFLNFFKKKFNLGKININNNAYSNKQNLNIFEEKIWEENLSYFKQKLQSKELLNLLNQNSKSKLPFNYACKYLFDKINEIFPELKDSEANKLQLSEGNLLTGKSQIDKGKKFFLF